MNSVTSGSILVSMLAALHSLTALKTLPFLCLILLGAAFLFAVWFFFVNIFKVISRRVFLEGRIYEKVPFQRMLFLLRVKKWTKVCCTMFRTSLYQMLWNFTIIGGVIKYYSYYLVPYIAAENPGHFLQGGHQPVTQMMKGHNGSVSSTSSPFFRGLFLGLRHWACPRSSTQTLTGRLLSVSITRVSGLRRRRCI